MSTYFPTSNVTIGGSLSTSGGAGASTISIAGAGAGSYPNSVLSVSNGSTGASWSNSTNAKMTTKGQLHLEGETADIVMNGVSLKDILGSITDRLAILQPKPELFEKYDNLRQAYEHYKTLEALLHNEDKDE